MQEHYRSLGDTNIIENPLVEKLSRYILEMEKCEFMFRKFLLEHGQLFKRPSITQAFASLPFVATMGQCYRNSLTIAKQTDFIYVEGIATKITYRGVESLEHAWASPPQKAIAFDTTWPFPEPLAQSYFGIGLPFDFVMYIAKKVKSLSILQGWSTSHQYADEITQNIIRIPEAA